jgi:hypothetical protein
MNPRLIVVLAQSIAQQLQSLKDDLVAISRVSATADAALVECASQLHQAKRTLSAARDALERSSAWQKARPNLFGPRP